MTLTADGAEFILYARQVCQMFDNLLDKYANPETLKKKFGVSAQHYSFAVKAFVEMTRTFDISEYDFALRETKTSEVIGDVSSLKSEIGILYLSDFNRKILNKLFAASDIEFHSLIECKAYVYPLEEGILLRIINLLLCMSSKNILVCPSIRGKTVPFILRKNFTAQRSTSVP